MPTAKIDEQLSLLCQRASEIKLCMVVSSDGLVIAHHGNVSEPDLFGAYFLELNVVCEKILTELKYDSIEEIYIRSKSGAVTLLPIFDKGFLACLSSADINAGKIQILTWKYVNRISEYLVD
ncbi:roadblock/LC7 domain-containing protein [Marinobacter salexigens]|uniref:roadblock/LC7 domain-containing protein n=1 Tax=Marinobacter salexigens TaxID=1925763 RepID=UPI000C28CE62|nr:roadblock/LC7 domain-containing protein [Marinobacter salexigens]